MGGVDPGGGAGQLTGQLVVILSFVPSRVESDRATVSLPSSPDPFKTPSRTSPLLPLPPYPPPEHTSRDGSGKSCTHMAFTPSLLSI